MHEITTQGNKACIQYYFQINTKITSIKLAYINTVYLKTTQKKYLTNFQEQYGITTQTIRSQVSWLQKISQNKMVLGGVEQTNNQKFSCKPNHKINQNSIKLLKNKQNLQRQKVKQLDPHPYSIYIFLTQKTSTLCFFQQYVYIFQFLILIFHLK
ncbi:transmembrane protein, putative (macronuclear) [Tetrahymena thermophila SB210]|uniref:Transmembrane protein, putative n=1 Tax=Tetrahymena thermophila (strain SB210) TaxID=312017 RepID=W7XF40_TETTS|nr:transmembrane protein, putative [Tetrahymena thermophila SB210]EWS75408.1 transmembrane protein, putative [Tetrahymena thermophila SB210]|eukprot:XP_012652082.1 transmembrane protein, putative [Tetrahymena thermophila SB210]